MSNVSILFGGASSERLVSVASAQNVAQHLPEARLWFWSPAGALLQVSAAELAAHAEPFVKPFVPQTPLKTFETLEGALATLKDSVVFLALHGGTGEDGTIQALFEKNGVLFTGSRAAACRNAFNKETTKRLAADAGALIAPARLFSAAPQKTLEDQLKTLFETAPRWVLKPCSDGSSQGLFHLRSIEQVPEAAGLMARLQVAYLAEVFVDGRELTVGVVDFEAGTQALPVSEVKIPTDGAFDYEGKYLGRGTQEITPAKLTAEESQSAQALALLTHRVLGCTGYSRTDMMLTETGPVLLEINTLPGLTKASFIPQQLAAAEEPFGAFLKHQLKLAQRAR
jgi:D-alanine-D-alanine ligase